MVGLRPEHLVLGDAPVTFGVRPTLVESLGSEKYVYFDAEGARIADGEEGKSKGLIARVSHTGSLPRDEEIRLGFDPAQLYLFDQKTGERL
ncbi:Trehalose import ATP-binding protein SugC [compost metagenome]